MLFLTLGMAAHPITPKQALSKARQLTVKRIAGRPSNPKIAYQTKRHDGQPGVFVVSLGHDQGFVVLSGEDTDDEPLGYCDSGNFDASQIPDNMKAWLDICTAEIEASTAADTLPAKASRVKAVSIHPTEVIEPLITTQWGQWPPFNKLCPYDNGKQTPVGCTGTALAQVLRYHRFPSGTTQTIPAYVTTTSKIKMPALPVTTFNWDLMPEVVTDETPEECIDEIAKLMIYCGQALDMSYQNTGSGAYTYLIPERLPKYFGYPSTMHYEYRESYDEEGWDHLLITELICKQPVIYTAYTNNGPGHTFIIDGYDGKGYYHFNWGWVGAGNGYYRISSAHAKGEGLSPNVKNYHLSINQTALVGLKSSGIDDYVGPYEEMRAYSRPSLKNGRSYTRETTAKAFTDIIVSQSVINTLSYQKAFYYGMGLYDDTGNLVASFKPTPNTSTFAAGKKKDIELTNISFGADTLQGHFTLRAIYKESKSADWQMMGGTDKNYIDVVIDDTQLTLTPIPKANFAVNAVWMDQSYLQIDFDNNDEAFYGPIYLRTLDTKTNTITEVCHDNLSADPQTHVHFELYIPEDQTFDPTKNTFYLSVDPYDSQYFYTNAATGQSNIHKQVIIDNLNDDGSAIVGDRVMGRFVVRNDHSETYDGTLRLTLADDRDNIDVIYSNQMSITPADSIVVSFEYPISDIDRTYRLRAIHQTGATMWACDSTDALSVSKGAIYWNRLGEIKVAEGSSATFQVPEEALAIILGNAYTTNVKPNSNPNTIYMLNTTLPKGLAKSNYVSSSYQGTNLTLTDGHDYLIPRELTFTGKVSYERVLSDSDSLVWTTLSLPFRPATITADATAIQPRQGDDDTDNHLRILLPMEVNDTVVATTYITDIEAYTPYLMAYDTVLVGKTIRMEATKCTLAPTLSQSLQTVAGRYTLHGTYAASDRADNYTFDGNRLRHSDEGTGVEAFRAYLTTDSIGAPQVLAIDIDNPQPEIVEPVLLGDANKDGQVNVADAMSVVGYILGQSLEVFSSVHADHNQDGAVDIADVSSIIGAILGTEPQEP